MQAPAQVTVGELVRSWRTARAVSQERLAARAGISTRHLSFIETGRSAPGREVVLAVAGALDVPLRARNELLLAAGFAPAYRASRLDGDDLAIVRRALDHVLRQQEPFPAVVFDRLCRLIEMNRAAARLFARLAPPGLPDEAHGNLLLALLHPDGWKHVVVNWDQVCGALIERLHREIAAAPGDRELIALRDRALAYPGVPAEWRSDAGRLGASPPPFVEVHLRHGGVELRMFTMLTTLGTPLDVTAEDLRIESYFPADAATEATLRAWAISASAS
jgi:transcriptional regulator with XRE-family HTH domain